MGLAAVGRTAIAPTPAMGASVFTDVERAGPPAQLVRFFARLSFDYVRTARIAAGPGAAETDLFTARLEFCPLQVPLEPMHLLVRACPAGELGRLRAFGLDAARATSASAIWAAAGAVAHVELAVRPLRIELTGGLLLLTTRHSIVIAPPRVTVYDLPRVSATLGAGVGFHFP